MCTNLAIERGPHIAYILMLKMIQWQPIRSDYRRCSALIPPGLDFQLPLPSGKQT